LQPTFAPPTRNKPLNYGSFGNPHLATSTLSARPETPDGHQLALFTVSALSSRRLIKSARFSANNLFVFFFKNS
jgi:hypothetical protein